MKNGYGYFRLIAKVLVSFMVIQGMPLYQLSRAYTWEPEPKKISRILDFFSFGVTEANAASITPGTYTSSLAQGQSITIQRTVTLDSNGPAANLVDVFFLADNTGSMGGFINTVRNNAQLILDAITGGDSRFAGIDVAFGVGYYRGDPREFGSSSSAATYAYGLQQSITTSISDVRTAINGWRASGGGDGPEANFFALHQVATSGGQTDGTGSTDRVFETGYDTGWRPNAARVIVWFGDYRSHTTTVDLQEAIDALLDNNITVAAINTRGATTGINASGQANDIAVATSGTLTNNVTGTSATVSAILNAVEAATATVDLGLETRGDTSGLTINFSCASSVGCDDVPPGESRIFDMTIMGDTLGTYQYEVFAPHVTGAVAQDTTIVRPCVSNLTVRTKSEKAQLVWTDTGADHYAVYRSLTSGGPYTWITDTRSRYSTYLDYGLTDGTTYYYIVREVDSAGVEYCQTVEVSALPSGRPDTRPPNQAPQITSIPVTDATQSVLYAYSVQASDPNALDVLSYSLDIAPSGMSIDAATGLIQWTPQNFHVGSHQVVVRVQDPAGLIDSQLFSVMVENVNDAPVIVSSPMTSVRVNEPYVYSVNAIDPDVGDILTFGLLQAPGSMVIDPALGQITWTPDATQLGTHNIVVQVTDSGGLSASQLFSITVTEVNRTPSITTSPITAVLLGSDYVYDVDATDPNTGDTLSFSLIQAPSGMTIDENTGLIEWTPLNTQLGSHGVEVQVEDSGGLTDNQSFTLGVALPDLPPEITSSFVTTATEGNLYTYNVVVSDPNPGDTITYGLDAAPAGMSIDSASGLIQWTPAEAQVGAANVTVRVTDSTALSDTQSFTIDVANVEDRPTITSIPTISATYAVVYSYDVDANDSDIGDTLIFNLLQAPSGMTIDAATGLIQWTPQATQMGPNTVEVQVADSTALTATQNFVVVAIMPNLAPVFSSSPVTAATEGTLYAYDVDAIDLNPGDTITYGLDTAPAGMSINPASGLIQWTPAEAQVGTANVTVRVTDSTALSDTQSFTINVANVEDPPSITSVPITTATVELAYSYDADASDPDVGDTLTFSLDTAPAGMGINPASGLIQWTPAAVQAGTQSVAVRVTDTAGLFTTQSFDITVEQTPNEPPLFSSAPVIIANAGQLYSYTATATDPESDSLTFSLDAAPDGMVVDSATGLVQWGPTQAQLGAHEVTIRVTDTNGLFATQSFTVDVFSPPVATFSYSGVLTRLETISFDGSASTDPDGGVISSWQWDFGDGTSASGANATHVYSSAGSFIVMLTVTDDEGVLSSVSLTLDIAEIMVIAPDVVGMAQATAESAIVAAQLAVGNITTQNSATVPAGQVINQQPGAGVSVAINSPVDLVVSSGPVMVSVPDVTGLAQADATAAITAAGLVLGTVTPQMNLSVPEGQVLAQSPVGGASVALNSAIDITVAVHDDTVPPQVSVSLSANPVRPGQFTQVSVTASDNIGVSTISLTVDGLPVALDGNNQALYQAAGQGTFVVTAQAQDVAGNTGATSTDLIVSTADDDTAPTISLSYTPVNPSVGDAIDFSISVADDVGVDNDRIWLKVDGVYIPVGNGRASYVANRQGSIPAVASVYDLSGNYAQDAVSIPVAISGSDTQVPTANIATPTDGQEVFGLVDVVGTAEDANFAYYTLSLLAEGSTQHVEYFRSDVAVNGDVLGPLDGTLLENGFYTLRLTVVDQYGNAVADEVGVLVSGDQKLGDFTLSYSDMTIPLTGISLEVVRTYDSRIKTKRDFGVGWSLDIKQSVKLNENIVPGTGYEIYCTRSLFGTCLEWGVRSAQDHFVTIQIPGARKQEFKAAVVSSYASSGGIAQGYIRFDPQPGTYSTLEPLNSSQFDYLMSGDLLDSSFNVLNPNLYRLTLLDGTQYYYNQSTGAIYRIVDANNNTVDITDSGITHSSGAQILITRDASNRITSIQDGDGRTMTYDYDGVGNLKSSTDANGNITQYKYAANHYLEEIIDPRGILAIRTEYDDDGRMTRQIRADGQEVFIDNDLTNQRQTVTDFAGNETTFEYNNQGKITSKTDAMGNTWLYSYDARDNLTETVHPDGSVTVGIYDAQDNLLSETDELINTTTYSYNADGSVDTKTDAFGRTTQFAYDARGNQLRETGPDGTVLAERTFNSQGEILSSTNALGHSVAYTYDGAGNVLTETDSLGNVTTYTYDARGNKLTQTDPRGNLATFTYDDNNNLLTETDALGQTITYTYTSFNKIATITDKRGYVTENIYDVFGQHVETVFADGSSESKEFDVNGNIIAEIDADGRRTEKTYDGENRLQSILYPDSSTLSYEYDSRGRKIAQIDAHGNRTEYGYDVAGHLTLVRDAIGNETVYEYDSVGNRTAMVDTLGRRTEYAFDEYNRVSDIHHPDGTTTSYDYDAAGQKISETDKAGNITQFEWDAMGRLLRVIDAAGGIMSYGYDSAGNKISQTDPNGHTTTWDYDELNRLISRTLPEGQVETFAFDENGNQQSHTDFNSNKTVFTYDELNRVIRKSFHDGSDVDFTYTPTGKRETVTDNRGVTSYSYDTRDRLLQVSEPTGSTITYTYDANGNRTTLASPSGTSTYQFDDLNRLETVTDPEGGITSFTYDSVGNRESVTYPNGVVTGYSYDSLNRLIYLENRRSGGGVISSYTYTLGPMGNRIQAVEDSGRTVNYAYDTIYRLTEENIVDAGLGNETITYGYDAFGNRLTKTDSASVTTYSYDGNDRLLNESSPASSWTYSYDANGNTISKDDGTLSILYGYDPSNRLMSILGSGSDIHYTYDADGLRVSSDVGGIATHYLVDKNRDHAQVVEERDDLGGLAVSYLHAGGNLIRQRRGGSDSYYMHDGQMSSRMLVDAAGVVTDEYTYDAFGIMLGLSGSTPNQYLYTGQQYDPNSGFYYLRARYYNQATGRFITTDPWQGNIFEPVSLHKYLYASQNPVMYDDPSGLFFSLGGAMLSMSIQSSLRAISAVSVTAYLAIARVVPFSISGVHFIIARGRSALPYLHGTGQRGVTALQNSFMRFYGSVSHANALRAAHWGSHSGLTQALNKAINHGARTNPANIQWHHIVEQWAPNVANFGRGAIHSFANVVPTPVHVHSAISIFYSSAPQWVRAAGFTRVRDWMATQSWDAQFRYGIEIWKQAMKTGGRINWTP